MVWVGLHVTDSQAQQQLNILQRSLAVCKGRRSCYNFFNSFCSYIIQIVDNVGKSHSKRLEQVECLEIEIYSMLL